VATLLNADWLSSREIRVKVEIFQLERICRGTNPRERARRKIFPDWAKLAKIATKTGLKHLSETAYLGKR
jgi:hypothetical protein